MRADGRLLVWVRPYYRGMPNLIEIHLVSGDKIQLVADSLGTVQSAMQSMDPFKVFQDRSERPVAVRLDKVTHLVDLGETRDGGPIIEFI